MVRIFNFKLSISQFLNFSIFILFFSLLLLPVINTAWAASVALPQTGQTTCYNSDGAVISCANTGQDGDTAAGVAWPSPRFTDNGNGTMKDKLTGLIWLKDADCIKTQYPAFDSDGNANGRVAWQRGLDFVKGINDGTYSNCGAGFTDWRLPNVNELGSLLNEEDKAMSWLNDQGFTNVKVVYMSGTTLLEVTSHEWATNLNDSVLASARKSTSISVWPVRGATTGSAQVSGTGQTTCYDTSGNVISCANTGQDGDIQAGVAWPSPRFTDNGDGTITDNLTGMIWLKDANCIKTQYPAFDRDGNVDGGVAWQNALDFVKGINLGTYSDCGAGFADWRLPNVNELHSLTDYSQSDPALPSGHPFTNVQHGSSLDFYASSTSDPGITFLVKGVRMYIGLLHTDGKTIVNFGDYVWPVRGGQTGASPPTPDIKANGIDDPITASTSTPPTIQVTLGSGSRAGENADWFLADYYEGNFNNPPAWWYYSSSGSWKRGLRAAYQGPLVDITTAQVRINSPEHLRSLTGIHNFYLAVDMNMNGSPDTGADLFYDREVVTVVDSLRLNAKNRKP